MKYPIWIYVFVIVLSAGGIALVVGNRDKPLDWTKTFRDTDKRPYGTYILRNILPELLQSDSMHDIHSTVYSSLNIDNESNNDVGEAIYFSISERCEYSALDIVALLDFAEKGNTVFIASEEFPDFFLDSLQLRQERIWNDSNELHAHILLPPNHESVYVFRTVLWHQSFSLQHQFLTRRQEYIDSVATHLDSSKPEEHYSQEWNEKRYYRYYRHTALSNDRLGNCISVCCYHGKGKIILHSNPAAFTNFALTDNKNRVYAETLLSFMPKEKLLLWDKHYNSAAHNSSSPLRVLLIHEPLRAAFYAFVSLSLLYMFFFGRRKQKAIPVIEPKTNTTLEFAQTIGSIYFQTGNRRSTAEKRIAFFLEYVRTHYYLSIHRLNDEFVNTLASKSDVDSTEINRLVSMILYIRKSPDNISEETLFRLSERLEKFYASDSYSRR